MSGLDLLALVLALLVGAYLVVALVRAEEF